MSNLGLRLLSLIISILLFVYVTGENNVTSARMPVAVEVREPPADKVVVWQLKRQVEVEIRGPSFLVSRVSTSPPTIRIKIPDDVGSRFIAHITAADLKLDPPLQIVSIDPPDIAFTIEKRVTKQLPIKVPKFGQLSEEFRLEEINIDPSTIMVSGPESELKDLQSVSTASIDLREIKPNYSEELPLKVPGKQTELSVNTVKVSVKVSQPDVRKEFSKVPVEIRTALGDGLRVEPDTVAVQVSGAKDKIAQLAQSSIIPYVRIPQGAQAPITAIAVQVEVPTGIAVIATAPETVTVVRQAAKKR